MKRSDLIWGYAAQLLNIGIGLLILPILVITLTSEELGLWYVFMAMAGLAQLLEFGFQPTIARQVAYVYSGATEIRKIGLPTAETGKLNTELLINVIYASKKIYRIISLSAAVLLLGGGTLYINSLAYTGNATTAYTSWIAFALASIITFYFGYYNALLQGRGDITKVNIVIVISRLVLLIVAVLLLLLGFGLLAMALASLISCVLNRLLICRCFYNDENKYLRKLNPTKNLIDILWGSSWRLGFVQLGSFLIQRGNIFIAATCLGLGMAASYGLTLQIAMLISALSSQLTSLQLPKMNAMQASGNRDELIKLYSSSVIAGLIMVICGFAALIILGDELLSSVHSEIKLLSRELLIIFCIVVLLEVHHSISATYLTTCNHVPFLLASIVSGVSVTFVTFLLVQWGGGVISLIIGQGLVQALFNNWYWPMVAMRHLKISCLDILSVGSKTLYSLLTKKHEI